MKFFEFLLLILFIQIFSDDDFDDYFYDYNYSSPCENARPKTFEDCLGLSCEFIEEKCCYLEAVNSTNSTNKECIDFYVYDYMREDLKQKAIQKIINGTYWESYNDTYQKIIELKCKDEYLNFVPIILISILMIYFL